MITSEKNKSTLFTYAFVAYLMFGITQKTSLMGVFFIYRKKAAIISRVPTDIPLDEYIRNLIANDNLVEFYQSQDWKELRQEVLEDCHNECQECLKHGRLTKADCVHHVNEVKKRPDLALSKTYVDADGNEQLQLVPLCNECHNIVHDKLGNYNRQHQFINEERW